jgi:uncharacterized membrane protein SpoIIM required for sporulation
MSPAQFEATYAAQWDELEALLAATEQRSRWRRAASQRAVPDAERLAALYRAICEHLALARGRAYPIHLSERLEDLAHRAHRLIYRQHDIGWQRLKRFLGLEVPAALRAQWRFIAVAGLLFVGPMLAMGLATWGEPARVLALMEVTQASGYEDMYRGGEGKALGRARSADTDWQMFGFYVRHNTGIGFQCFAGGLLAGAGSVFFLVYNGLQIGGVAGFLTARGHGENFWSFVASHAPFELTAIVISGGAGLMLGYALLAPGRLRRSQALAAAARDSVPLVGAVILLLLIAAALEAFWSSSAWVPPAAKFATSAFGWLVVWAYARRRGA